MDLGSIFLILALLLLVGLYVGRPFFDHKGISVSREEREHSSLLAERDRILSALEELDFDYSMGKIPEEDYPAQRSLLLKRGADVLRHMDAQQGQTESQKEQATLKAFVAESQSSPASASAAGENGSRGLNGKTRISGNARVAGPETADDEIEVLIASRRRARSEKAAGFCPMCGGPLQKSDLFCPKCGAGVKN